VVRLRQVSNRFRTTGKRTKARKLPAAVVLGKLGGRKGGPARAKVLSSAKKSQIAKHSANRRWGNNTSYQKPAFYKRKPR
jgi:hypothetical protein